MARVFFGTSGSDANETQPKLIWYYNNLLGRPKKKDHLPLERLSRLGRPDGQSHRVAGHAYAFRPAHGSILHVTCPHYYRQAPEGMNERQFSRHLAEELESLIEREGADTVAAFFAEPSWEPVG